MFHDRPLIAVGFLVGASVHLNNAGEFLLSGVGDESPTRSTTSNAQAQALVPGRGARRTPRMGTGWKTSPEPTREPKITVATEVNTPIKAHQVA